MTSLKLVRGSLQASTTFANSVRRVFEAAKVPVALEETTVAKSDKGSVILGVGLNAQEQQQLKAQTGALTAITSTRLSNLYPNSIYNGSNVVVVASQINDNEELFDLTVESQRVALAGLNTKIVSGGLVHKFQKQRDAILAQVEAALQESITVAVAEARNFPDKQRTISVVFKDQGSETSPFDTLLFNALKKHLHNLGDAAKDINVDHIHTAAIYNKIIMFPETVRVVLTPPEYYGERVHSLVRGIGGGNGFVPVTFTNGKDQWIYTSHSASNPIAPLLSATNALRNDAFKAANLADKIEKAIGKTLISTAPSDVPNGKATPEQFVDAVLKNL